MSAWGPVWRRLAVASSDRPTGRLRRRRRAPMSAWESVGRRLTVFCVICIDPLVGGGVENRHHRGGERAGRIHKRRECGHGRARQTGGADPGCTRGRRNSWTIPAAVRTLTAAAVGGFFRKAKTIGDARRQGGHRQLIEGAHPRATSGRHKGDGTVRCIIFTNWFPEDVKTGDVQLTGCAPLQALQHLGKRQR